MASAPALMSFVGGSAVDALKYTAEAGTIYVTRGLWPELVIPALDWAGVPMLLDVACVVATGRCPAINTGIAHKDPGGTRLLITIKFILYPFPISPSPHPPTPGQSARLELASPAHRLRLLSPSACSSPPPFPRRLPCLRRPH